MGEPQLATAPAATERPGQALRDVFRPAYRRYAERIAFSTEGARFTFAEIGDRVARISSLLDRLGIGSADFVGMVPSPRPELTYETRLATFEHGACLFGINPNLPRDVLISSLRSVNPRVVFYDADYAPQVPQLLAMILPEVRVIAARGPKGDYEGLLSTVEPLPSENSIDPRGLAALGYTSGTTGAPKGVTATHGSLQASFAMMCGSLPLEQESAAGLGFLDAVPLFAAGGGMIGPALVNGMTLHAPARFTSDWALELMEREPIAYAFFTPSMLIDLLDDPRLDVVDLRRLRAVIYGSASLPAAKIDEAVRRIGPVLLQGYGMSELLPPVAMLSPGDHGTREQPASRRILSSVGTPVPPAQVRIESPEGAVLGPMEVGEIAIHSPTMTPGYWNDPERNEAAMRGGWWHSGDIGFLDREGRLYLLDRSHDVIRRGERPIYPREIEDVCSEHPMVKEVCAVQPHGSDRIVAAVSVRREWRERGNRELERALFEFLEVHLPPALVPDEIRFLPELPRSIQGKVLKREVRDVLSS